MKIGTLGNLVDELVLRVIGGRGGRGGISFDRCPTVSRAKPNGGNGGPGGSVFFKVDSSLTNLSHLTFSGLLVKGGDGGHGGKDGCTGSHGINTFITLPIGCRVRERAIRNEVYDEEEEVEESDEQECETLLDFTKNDVEPVIAAMGGMGGRGNLSMGLNNHEYEEGQLGEEKLFHIELCILADVGLVGLPNAGKSTLLAQLTRAQPRIADYAFTTLRPYIGVVSQDTVFTMADLPGLIEGAHLNKGLGHGFLRHVERARLLCLLVDISKDSYLEDAQTIMNELRLHQANLDQKVGLVIGNKADLISTGEVLRLRIESLQRSLGLPAYPVAAKYGSALPLIVRHIEKLLAERKREIQ